MIRAYRQIQRETAAEYRAAHAACIRTAAEFAMILGGDLTATNHDEDLDHEATKAWDAIHELAAHMGPEEERKDDERNMS